MDRVAQIIYNHFQDSETKNERYVLPIDKIDEVKVSVYLRQSPAILTSEHVLGFTIEDAEEKYENGECWYDLLFHKNFIYQHKNLSLKEVKELLTQVIQIIESLNFSTYHGMFLTMKPDEFQKEWLFKDIIKSSKVEYKFGDCCVCLDTTRTKTTCGHFLCVKCFQKLKLKNCPLCRHRLALSDVEDEEGYEEEKEEE